MNEYKDFYFIYVAVGQRFIQTIKHNFTSIPNNANIVVITTTPKILEDINPHFNLIIVDLYSLQDDWSKENEILLDIENDQEYIKKYMEMYENGYRFPIEIQRFGLKWAVKNGITKFVVMESGYEVGFMREPLTALKTFNKWGKIKNVLFGNTFYDVNNDGRKFLNHPDYNKVLQKYNIDLKNYPPTFHFESDPNKTGLVTFEGGLIGFWFHDIMLIDLFYNIYTDIIKISHINKHIVSANGWANNFEWVFHILNPIFAKYFNTILAGHQDIATHFYHPEDFYFMKNARNIAGVSWIDAPTRDEFIEKNRENMIIKFGSYEIAKKVCYNFK